MRVLVASAVASTSYVEDRGFFVRICIFGKSLHADFFELRRIGSSRGWVTRFLAMSWGAFYGGGTI